jgi:hypothetical protein
MTDQHEPQRDNPARPIGSLDDVEADATTRRDGQRRGLPAHEIDEDETAGGGMMSQGGTAIDRGTGTLAGQAQGREPGDDEEGTDTIARDAGVGVEDD